MTKPPNTLDKSPVAKIELRDVAKSFDDKQVLNGVNLSVAPGESMVIIGGSGTGKSVMIKAILGLLNIDRGAILIDGQNTVGLRGRSRDALMQRFGMLFQGGALFDSLTIWENIAFGLVQGQRMPAEKARIIALEKLQQVGLSPDIAEQFPAALSGGMQKRVGLARAIAGEPDVIFFDEPTTGLDPIMAGVINELIVECVKDLGATALTITHDMDSARHIADHVAMLHMGEIIWHGPVETMDSADNPYLAQFIHGQSKGPITGATIAPPASVT